MTGYYAAVDAALTAPGAPFEIVEDDIRGVRTRVWRETPGSLTEVLERGRLAGGDAPFIILGDERLSHRAHHEKVISLARALVEKLGVEKGDRVAIAMRNYTQWSVAFFAAVVAGAVAVPLNAFWSGAELAFGITDSDARVVFVDGERAARLAPHGAALGDAQLVGTHLDDRSEGALPSGILDMDELIDGCAGLPTPAVEIHPDDEATIFYTSGTTGVPKGVLGTHRNICTSLVNLAFARARVAVLAGAEPPPATPPARTTLVPVPLFHATGCHTLLVAQAFAGGTIVLMRKWAPELALELIERERIASVTSVPAMLWDLVNSPSLDRRDLRSLVTLSGGGAAVPPELVRRVASLLPGRGLSTGYGLTETSSGVVTIAGAAYEEHPDSVGAPNPVTDIRIVDDSGADVEPGERGEIWVRGPSVVLGYWHRPEETAAAFTDGWLHTGDIGRIDATGFLYIVDRAKDVIIRGGENIASVEVEAVFYEHPEVTEVAVFAVPHESLGEEVGAVVRLIDGGSADAQELRSHAAARLAPFKVPAHVWITSSPLPRNASGKVLKRDVRRAFVGSADDTA